MHRLFFIIVFSLLFSCPAFAAFNTYPTSVDTDGTYTLTWTNHGSRLGPPAVREFKNGSYTGTVANSGTSVTLTGRGTGTYKYELWGWKRYRGEVEQYRADTITVSVQVPISPPQNLSAPSSSTDGSYTVSWSSVSGTITHYTLQQSFNNGGWSNVQSSNALSKSFSGKAAGTYRYHVKACNGSDCSPWSSERSVQVQYPPSSAPGWTSSSVASTYYPTGTVAVSWSAVSNTNYYQLQERSGGKWVTRHSSSLRSASFSNRVLGSYAFRVRACNLSCGPWSSTRTVALQQASNISGPSQSRGQFTLTWLGPSLDYVNLSENGGSASKITADSITLTRGAGTYSFRIQRCIRADSGADDCTAYGQAFSVQVIPLPGSPTNITVPTNNSSGNFSVSWGSASGLVESYRLFKQLNGGSWTRVYSGSASSASVSGLADGDYRFRVSACNTVEGQIDCGSYRTSGTVPVAHTPGVPDSLTGVPATSSSGAFTVNWGSATGNVDYYELYRQRNGGNWELVFSGNTYTQAVSGLGDGQYAFRVKGCNVQSTFTTCGNYRTSGITTVALAPGVPASLDGVSATNTRGSYSLSWGAASGSVDSYELYQQTNGGTWTPIDPDTTTTYAVNGLADGRYAFQVRACNTEGSYTACGGYRTSVGSIVAHVPTVLSVPTYATNSTGSLTVNWNTSGGPVTYYDLEGQVNNGSWTTAASGVTGTSITLENLSNGDWHFRVRACNGYNWACTNYSLAGANSMVRLIPSTPLAPIHPATGNGAVSLTWSKPVGTVTYYDVQKQFNGETWSDAATHVTATQTTLRGLQEGNWSFAVRACNDFSWACSDYGSGSSMQVTQVEDWAAADPVIVPDQTPVTSSAPSRDVTVGAVAGEGGVSGGQASYAIPIQVPPGRSDMQPQVSLNYSSQSGNGILGMGWSLSVNGAISRCGQTLAHDGRTKNVTYSGTDDRLCLNGQRLVVLSGTYGSSGAVYRSELDDFTRITQYGGLNDSSTWFKAELKNGTVQTFGDTADSRFTASGAPAVQSWSLSREEDAASNSIHYRYTHFGYGEYHLAEIDYTGRGNTPGDRRIKFVYESGQRPDLSSAYLAGGLTAQTKRLEKIVTYYQRQLVLEYHFDYRISEASRRSLLSQVEKCGFEGNTQYCLPATDLSWQDAAPAFVLEPLGYRATPAGGNNHTESANSEVVAVLTDATHIAPHLPHGDGDGDGTPDWPSWRVSAEGVGGAVNNGVPSVCTHNFFSQEFHCVTGDIDQDGRTDSWRFGNGDKLDLAYSTGSGTQNWISTPVHADSFSDQPQSFADYNGDGWPDLLMQVDEGGPQLGEPGKLYLWLHSGNPVNPYTTGQLVYTFSSRVINNTQVTTESAQPVSDMDGNGLPDFIVYNNELNVPGTVYTGSEQPTPKKLLLTRLDTQGNVSFETVSLFAEFEQMAADRPTGRIYFFHMFMDVNGDGLSDWLSWRGNDDHLWLSLNRGGGAFAAWQDLGEQSRLATRDVPYQLVPNDPAEWDYAYYPRYAHAFQQFDYDADGRAELLIPGEIVASVCLERRAPNGTHTLCGEQIYDPFDGSVGPGLPHVVDLGRRDDNVFRFDAMKFVEVSPGQFTVVKTATPLVGSATQTAAVDAFGNGETDLVFTYGCRFTGDCTANSPGGIMAGKTPGTYLNRNRGSAANNERYEPTDMLVVVENGLGVRDEWHYRPLSSRDDRYHTEAEPFYEPDFDYLTTLGSQAQQAHFHFTSNMYVVAEHRHSNGVGGLNRYHYRYKGAMFNREGRGFQGFRTIIAEDLDAGIRTQSDFHQVFPLAGKLHKTRRWALNDAANDGAFDNTDAFEETRFSWQLWPVNEGQGGVSTYKVDAPTDTWNVSSGNPYFVGPDQQTSIIRTLTKTNSIRTELYRKTETLQFDDWGNRVVSESTYVEPGDSHQVKTRTHVQYATPDEVNWWLNKPERQTVTKFAVVNRNGVSIAADTDVEHTVIVDYLDWDLSVRKPKQIKTTPSNGKWTQLDTVYNDRGLPTSVTQRAQGEAARTTVTTYSDDGYFIQTVTNPLNQVVETGTNPRFGQPDWVLDVNGLLTETEYDAFGRAVKVSAPGVPSRYTRLQWCDSSCPPHTVLISKAEQAGSPTQTGYIDRLGRTLRTETEGFETGQQLVSATDYNSLGQVTFESVPQYNSASNQGTHYTDYDLLGRLVGKTVDQTDGQQLIIRYTHEQGDRGFTTNIDANGHTLSRTYNGLEQLLETVDALGGITRYAYDGAGNPIVLEDANGQQIIALYNALGQKEWVKDPNMGLKQFTYTGFGDEASETDGNGRLTEFGYDKLGRMTLRTVDGTAEARWIYDTAVNGIGLPAKEERLDQSFSKTYEYDGLSRPSVITTHIDGEDFVTASQYDSYFGRPKGLRYPSGLTLAYEYNERGYQTTVRNAGSGYMYREITEISAAGQWQRASLAAGTATVGRSFDNATGQARGSVLENLLGSLHSQSYTYDAFGNLKTIYTEVDGMEPATNTETLEYDDMHRLWRSSRTDGPTINYRYDAVGNLLSKDDYGSDYHYNGSRPNAVSSVDLVGGGSTTFGYDSNGNRTHENGVRTLWYNAFNKPVKIARAGTQLEFFYGADEMRYKQVNSAANRTTLYIDRLFEKITEGGVTKYRHFINDIAVVTTAVSTTGTSHQIGFTHRDRLGSPVAIVDAQGVLKETHSFDPFGKPRLGNSLDKLLATLGSGLTTRGFTDHEHLDDVQLIHMNGRVYDYNLGRFLSVDPIIQAPGNSQSLNSYSYIMNNPMAGTDPSGYCGKGDQEDSCGKLGVGDVLEATVKITHKPVTGSRLSKTSTKTVTVTNNGKGSVTYGVVGGDSTTLQIGGNNGSGGGSATSIGGQESRENVGGTSVGNAGNDSTFQLASNDDTVAKQAAASLEKSRQPDAQKTQNNDATCARIAQKICAIHEQLDKRWDELERDPLGLPERIGPGEKLSETIRGHRTIINQLGHHLNAREAQWIKNQCTGPVTCGGGGPGSPLKVVPMPVPRPIMSPDNLNMRYVDPRLRMRLRIPLRVPLVIP